MTTLAFDGKILAVDSQVCCGADITYRKKIFLDISESAGRIFTFTGRLHEALLAIDYLRAAPDKPTFESTEFEVFEIRKKQFSGRSTTESFEYSHYLKPVEIVTSTFAAGSGFPWAQAAMDHGATAIEAVCYAAAKDTSTGGDVCYVNIERNLAQWEIETFLAKKLY